MSFSEVLGVTLRDYKTDPMIRAGVWSGVATIVLFVGSLVFAACCG